MKYLLVVIYIVFSLSILPLNTSVAAPAVSKQQAAQIAQGRFSGRVVSVKPARENNKTVYRVKVLDKKGGMHQVIIDANSGQIISAY